MPTQDTALTVHPALGGLDIASDPTVLDPNFMVTADNLEFREGGQRKKRPGFHLYSTNYNSTSRPTGITGISMVGSNASVRAIQDAWIYRDSLTPEQHYLAVTGASIFISSGQGSWIPLTVSSSFGVDSNRQTNILLAGDKAIFSDGQSEPTAWDGLNQATSSLVKPGSIASTEPQLVAVQSTSSILISTTTGYTVTTTINSVTSFALITLTSTSLLILANGATITSPSTGTGAIFTSTADLTATSTSAITSTTPAMGSTSPTPLNTLQAVSIISTSTMTFQSLNGISLIVSNAVSFLSTNPFSNWPTFTQATYHLNRMFFNGVSTAPSFLGYTAANNVFDSTGADAGGFTINAGDGDRLMGTSKPFYGSLYAFKGPQFGSVFQLSGSTPATFAIAQVGYGAPLMNARGLITTPTDIYWISKYGIHSLETTVKFGNVEQAFLSLPIQKLWRDRLLDPTLLPNAQGFWHPSRNIVGWIVTPNGSAKAYWALCYNYALSDPKPGGKKFWSIWKLGGGIESISSAVMIVTSIDSLHVGDPHLYIGGHDGMVYEGDQDFDDTYLNDNGNAYTMTVKTPVITKFQTPQGNIPETQEKGFVGIVTYFNPKGTYSANLTVNIDRRVSTDTVSLAGGGFTLT